MRLDTVFKFEFTFEYWTLVANDNGTSYALDSERKGIVIPSGGSMSLITDEQLTVPMQVRSLVDPAGTEITIADGIAYPLYVTSAEPQFDPFSRVVAWRHTLRRELPPKYSQILQEVIDL